MDGSFLCNALFHNHQDLPPNSFYGAFTACSKSHYLHSTIGEKTTGCCLRLQVVISIHTRATRLCAPKIRRRRQEFTQQTRGSHPNPESFARRNRHVGRPRGAWLVVFGERCCLQGLAGDNQHGSCCRSTHTHTSESISPCERRARPSRVCVCVSFRGQTGRQAMPCVHTGWSGRGERETPMAVARSKRQSERKSDGEAALRLQIRAAIFRPCVRVPS